MEIDEVVRELNFLCKTDMALKKTISATKNRLQAINKEGDPKFDHVLNGYERGKSTYKGMEQVRGRIQRQIGLFSIYWPIWEGWLKNVPGIGPSTAGSLILLYYYRFKPVCAECGGVLDKKPNGDGKGNVFVCVDCEKKAKGEGVLNHKIELKDFPTVSKWWAYMGRSVIDGKMPKRKSGQQSNWSTVGRTLGFHFSDQCNRGNAGLYTEFFRAEREKLFRERPELSKGHNLNMARNHVVKLFLSHFWTVARTLDGKPLSEPYVQKYMGHTNILEPFYFERAERKEAV